MKIFVAGATGVVGRPLVHRLTEAGHDVTALSRSPERAEGLRAAGVRPVLADALDATALRDAVREAEPEVVVHELTNIPAAVDPRHLERDLAATDRLRTEGTKNLIEAARASGARRVIAQSIAFAYRPGPGEPRTERDPLHLEAPSAFAPVIAAVADLEAQVTDADLDGVVLRYGHLYGPGTAYAHDGSIHAMVRARRFPVAGKGTGTNSFVHVEDAAAATVAALEGPAAVYNVVDDEPAAASEWLPVYARLIGAQPPRRVPGFLARLAGGPYARYLMIEMPGASNQRARNELRWTPQIPSWRTGFANEFG